jgi:transmembrane sensor
MKNYDEIYVLISKSLTSRLTEEESLQLNNWISESREHRIEYNDVLRLWEKSKNLGFPEKLHTGKALNIVHKKAGIIRLIAYRLNLIQQIAAILFLSFLLSSVFSYFAFKRQAENSFYEEVSSAYGTRTHIELPDGSTVYLNSGSTLRFPNQLKNGKVRRVELTGEGFFKVTKDPKRPFIVQSGKLEVKALGTEFDVNAYAPETGIEVALVEGKVAVGTTHMKSKETVILTPNQLARYLPLTNKISKEVMTEPEKYTGWTNGKMVFSDDPIQKVIQRIENWYNVKIRVEDDQLKKYRFTGTFVNESVEEILNAFSLTSPLQYEITAAQIDSNGKYTKREIILKSK